jgi:hypothetical protein
MKEPTKANCVTLESKRQYFRVRLNNRRREIKLAKWNKNIPFLIKWPQKRLQQTPTENSKSDEF